MTKTNLTISPFINLIYEPAYVRMRMTHAALSQSVLLLVFEVVDRTIVADIRAIDSFIGSLQTASYPTAVGILGLLLCLALKLFSQDLSAAVESYRNIDVSTVTRNPTISKSIATHYSRSLRSF